MSSTSPEALRALHMCSGCLPTWPFCSTAWPARCHRVKTWARTGGGQTCSLACCGACRACSRCGRKLTAGSKWQSQTRTPGCRQLCKTQRPCCGVRDSCWLTRLLLCASPACSRTTLTRGAAVGARRWVYLGVTSAQVAGQRGRVNSTALRPAVTCRCPRQQQQQHARPCFLCAAHPAQC